MIGDKPCIGVSTNDFRIVAASSRAENDALLVGRGTSCIQSFADGTANPFSSSRIVSGVTDRLRLSLSRPMMLLAFIGIGVVTRRRNAHHLARELTAWTKTSDRRYPGS